MKYSLLEDYEWVGTFWFNKYTKYTFSGKLSYSPMKGIKLEVVFKSSDLQEKSFKDFLNKDKEFDINGAIRQVSKQSNNTICNTQAVSLFNCTLPRTGIIHDFYNSYYFNPTYFIIANDYFDSLDTFKHCRVSYNALHEFMLDYKDSKQFDLLSFNLGESEVKLKWGGEIIPLYKDDIIIPSYCMKNNAYINRFNERKEKLFDDTEEPIYPYYIKDHYYYFDIHSSLKEGFTVDYWLKNNVYELKSFLEITLFKKVYTDNCCLVYKDSDNNKHTACIFVYYGYTYEDIQEAKTINKKPYFPIIPILYHDINNDSLNSKMEQYKSILDNKDSILLSSLLGFIKQREYNIYERLILLVRILEEEYKSLVKEKVFKEENNKRYDKILNHYLTEHIKKIYLNVFRDDEYDKDSEKLKELLHYEDNNKEYFRIGTVIKYFRDCLVHGKNDLGINDKKTTEAYKHYSQYWQGEAKNNIINNIIHATTVILFRILYSKIGFTTEELDDITSRLLFRTYQNYYGRDMSFVGYLVRQLSQINISHQDLLSYNPQVDDFLNQERSNFAKNLSLATHDNKVVNSIFKNIKEYYKTTVQNNINESCTLDSCYKPINYDKLFKNKYNLTYSSSEEEIRDQFTNYLTKQQQSSKIKKHVKDFIKKVEHKVYLSFKDIK